jgi:hypothetical protein
MPVALVEKAVEKDMRGPTSTTTEEPPPPPSAGSARSISGSYVSRRSQAKVRASASVRGSAICTLYTASPSTRAREGQPLLRARRSKVAAAESVSPGERYSCTTVPGLAARSLATTAGSPPS